MFGKNPKVQFIHESGREFFLEDALRRIWPELKGDFRGERHERLKQCCIKYISIAITSLGFEFVGSNSSRREVETKLPFLEYAIWGVLYHANGAATFGVDQARFLRSLDLADWMKFEVLFEQYRGVQVQRPQIYGNNTKFR